MSLCDVVQVRGCHRKFHRDFSSGEGQPQQRRNRANFFGDRLKVRIEAVKSQVEAQDSQVSRLGRRKQ